MNIPDTKY